MIYIQPKFERKHHPAGTYKLTFDDKWFYIGSSVNLRNRCSRWKFTTKTGKELKQKNIKSILPNTKVVKFSILRIYVDKSILRDAETKLLSKHWNNPNLLNRCPDANSPKNLRHYFGYVPPIKKVSNYIKIKKPIAKFSKEGVLIKLYESKFAAKNDLRIKESVITKIVKGLRGQLKNYILKAVSPDGNIIEPPLYNTKYKSKVVPTFYVINSKNQIAGEFNNCTEASKFIGDNGRNVSKVLKGTHRYHSIKGYTFVYKNNFGK